MPRRNERVASDRAMTDSLVDILIFGGFAIYALYSVRRAKAKREAEELAQQRVIAFAQRSLSERVRNAHLDGVSALDPGYPDPEFEAEAREFSARPLASQGDEAVGLWSTEFRRQPDEAPAAGGDTEALLVRIGQQVRAAEAELVQQEGYSSPLSRAFTDHVLRPLERAESEARAGRAPAPDALRKLLRAAGAFRHAVNSRARGRGDRTLDAASAFAQSIWAVLLRFGSERALALPRGEIVVLPRRAQADEVWRDRLPGVLALTATPSLGSDPVRWPSVPHELGHLLWSRLPGLRDELSNTFRLTEPTYLLDPRSQRVDDLPHRLVRAWAPELFADVFGALVMGPSAVRGLLLSAETGNLNNIRRVGVDLQTARYAENPPVALRVHVLLEVLRARGFDDEADVLEREFERRQPGIGELEVPIAGGRIVTYPLAPMAEYVAGFSNALLSRQLDALGGASLQEIPGLGLSARRWRQAAAAGSGVSSELPAGLSERDLVIAAMESALASGGSRSANANALVDAIVGRSRQGAGTATRERRGASGQRAVGAFSRDEIRDALVLGDIMGRRRGPHRPRPFSAQSAA